MQKWICTNIYIWRSVILVDNLGLWSKYHYRKIIPITKIFNYDDSMNEWMLKETEQKNLQL